MIPKAGTAADLYAVDALVTAIEAGEGPHQAVGFEVIIETAARLRQRRARSPPPARGCRR